MSLQGDDQTNWAQLGHAARGMGKNAADLAEGYVVVVRIKPVEVPTEDVRDARRKLGLSQAAFAAKFGFHPATMRNREQGRKRRDGPARVLLAVIAQHPEAVEDSLRRAS